MGEDQKKEKEIERWAWRDTLNRIHHIDEVIDTIVSCGIALTVGTLGALGGLLGSLLSESTSGFVIIVQGALAMVVLVGSVINLFLAWELARQEWIRQWYFALYPNEKLPPLKPDEKWLHQDIPNNYLMDEPKPQTIKKPEEKRRRICQIGKRSPGYCIMWFRIFSIIAIIGYVGGSILILYIIWKKIKCICLLLLFIVVLALIIFCIIRKIYN